MKAPRPTQSTGGWVKASEIKSGVKCKLVSEASFEDGEYGKKLVARIRFQGEEGDSKNININKPSHAALVDAFGEETKSWCNNLLTAHTEKMLVAGKRVTALYLIPENFELTEDDNGYLVIVNPAQESTTKKETPSDESEIDPDDIPF